MDPDEVYSLVPYEKGFLFVTLLEEEVGREAFDIFLRDYIEAFRFTSITTAEFEAFVEKVFPGLLEKVRAEEWLRKPGIPDNAPDIHSPRLEKLQGLPGIPAGARLPGMPDLGTMSMNPVQFWMQTADMWQKTWAAAMNSWTEAQDGRRDGGNGGGTRSRASR